MHDLTPKTSTLCLLVSIWSVAISHFDLLRIIAIFISLH
jgi:hypothetical protein